MATRDNLLNRISWLNIKGRLFFESQKVTSHHPCLSKLCEVGVRQMTYISAGNSKSPNPMKTQGWPTELGHIDWLKLFILKDIHGGGS